MPETRRAASEEIPGLDQILQGDCEQGYYRFYAHYFPIVTAMVRNAGIAETLEGAATAEDAAHDIIARFVGKGSASLNRLRTKDHSTMKACFWTAVMNEHKTFIADKVKHRERWGRPLSDKNENGRENFSSDEVVAGYARSRSPRPDDLFEIKELALHVEKVMGALPHRHACIVGMLAEGMNQPEMAEALGVGLSSMGSRVNRARSAAKDLLKVMNPQLHKELVSVKK